MTLHSRVCCVKLTENIAITLNEKTCLSVCRRQCPTERGHLLGTAGRPAEQSSQEAQIRTLLDEQKEQILAECQAEINRHEFQAAYDRRSLRKLGEIVESQQEALHCAQAEEVQRRDQQLLQGQLLCASRKTSHSTTLAAVMCDAEEPFSVHTAYEPASSFTTSPRRKTRPLYF